MRGAPVTDIIKDGDAEPEVVVDDVIITAACDVMAPDDAVELPLRRGKLSMLPKSERLSSALLQSV